jgi:acyl-CoA synthetase (NDP forming)
MPDLTYAQLAKATADLARDITRSAEAIRLHAKTIDDEAKDTTRVAESIASLKVDSATVAETREVGRIMAGLSEAVLAYAAAGDDTARAAQAAHDQNKASHSGIGEAVSRSPVGREIYDLDRGWLTQE